MLKKQYTLAIDTTAADTGIGLAGESQQKIKTWLSERNQSRELLPNIDRLLHTAKIQPEQLKQVTVNLGPGSFTGLRIGISIANAFGYALKIPVVGKANLAGDAKQRIERLLQLKGRSTTFKIARPVYGRGPRITKSRPKNYR